MKRYLTYYNYILESIVTDEERKYISFIKTFGEESIYKNVDAFIVAARLAGISDDAIQNAIEVYEKARPPKLTTKQRKANQIKGEVTQELLGDESPIRGQIDKIFKMVKTEIKKKAAKKGIPLNQIDTDSLTIKS